ncbi:MAG TPA: prenyltransferase/squalene oxidase repeat-containing protein [Phototrophicaceae bacterium]|nr:prenyltransferase/squalene oxidase repeat-containing protein [Phototrophicaceae bacterium]
MGLLRDARDLLKTIGSGHMMSTAYDTAWVARLSQLDEPVGNEALVWLRHHQLADGSWGAENPGYYHDRLICTLAAAVTLAHCGEKQDVPRLARAKEALETTVRTLGNQAMIETIGFELIAPTLFAEAESLGLITRWEDGEMTRLDQQRAAKLNALPGGLINRYVTLAFSAEMAGTDSQRLLDVDRLQEANGSLGHSPSATAYFVLQIRQDAVAMNYLRGLSNGDGGIPDVAPFDNFERAWTLWNLHLADSGDSELQALVEPHLDFLESAWIPDKGAGYGAGYSVPDSDMTSVIGEVVLRYGRQQDISPLMAFESSDYFKCFLLEANPSVSANIHVLGALRQAGFERQHPAVQKIRRFLYNTQFWFDKWHVSPYYPTTHAIIACVDYLDDLIEDAVTWILTSQNPDGSWGWFSASAEETAYCLQALVVWRRHGHPVPEPVLRRGATWLAEHQAPPYVPLWIGKCLYCPTLVVQSAIISALTLVSQELGVRTC